MFAERTRMELPPTHTEGFHTEESVRGIRYRQLGKTDMMVGCVTLRRVIFSQYVLGVQFELWRLLIGWSFQGNRRLRISLSSEAGAPARGQLY